MNISDLLYGIENDHIIVMTRDLVTLYEGDKVMMPYWLNGYAFNRVESYDDFTTIKLGVSTWEMWTPNDSAETVGRLDNQITSIENTLDEWRDDFSDIRSLVNVIRRKLDRDDLTNIPALLDEICNLC